MSRRLLLGLGVALLFTLATSGIALAFTDVSSSSQYSEAIADLSGRSVISGFSDGTFRPLDTIKRMQFAKMMVKALNLPVSEANACPFGDVPSNLDPNDPFYPDHYVAVCAANQIITGKTFARFAPTDQIIRAQVITMVVRACENLRPGVLADPSSSYESTWGDFDPTHGANAAKAEFNGLLEGLPLAQLDPLGPMPRGEVAQILHNLLGMNTTPTTPRDTVQPSVDDSIKVSKVIGPEGGSLSVTDARGTLIQLVVPEGALYSPVEISMSPLAGVEGLPASGTYYAGAAVKPEGLGLFDLAQLIIRPLTPVSSSTVLAGFGCRGSGEDFFLRDVEGSTAEVIVPISHFSNYGVGIWEDGPDVQDYIKKHPPDRPQDWAEYQDLKSSKADLIAGATLIIDQLTGRGMSEIAAFEDALSQAVFWYTRAIASDLANDSAIKARWEAMQATFLTVGKYYAQIIRDYCLAHRYLPNALGLVRWWTWTKVRMPAFAEMVYAKCDGLFTFKLVADSTAVMDVDRQYATGYWDYTMEMKAEDLRLDKVDWPPMKIKGRGMINVTMETIKEFPSASGNYKLNVLKNQWQEELSLTLIPHFDFNRWIGNYSAWSFNYLMAMGLPFDPELEIQVPTKYEKYGEMLLDGSHFFDLGMCWGYPFQRAHVPDSTPPSYEGWFNGTFQGQPPIVTLKVWESMNGAAWAALANAGSVLNTPVATKKYSPAEIDCIDPEYRGHFIDNSTWELWYIPGQ